MVDGLAAESRVIRSTLNALKASGPNSVAGVPTILLAEQVSCTADLVDGVGLPPVLPIVPLGELPVRHRAVLNDGDVALLGGTTEGRPEATHSPIRRSYSSLLDFVPWGPR